MLYDTDLLTPVHVIKLIIARVPTYAPYTQQYTYGMYPLTMGAFQCLLRSHRLVVERHYTQMWFMCYVLRMRTILPV